MEPEVTDANDAIAEEASDYGQAHLHFFLAVSFHISRIEFVTPKRF